MDAASRSELDRLRVRAYGPAADIDGDAVALQRLIDLEALALADRGGPSVEASAPAPAPVAAPVIPPEPMVPVPPEAAPVPEPTVADAPATAPPASTAPALSRRAAVALAAVGGALILAIGGIVLVRVLTPAPPVTASSYAIAPAVREARTAYSFAWDREAVPLLQIPLDGSFGRYIDLPTATHVPDFPSTGAVDWAYPLGKYFGWDVWIAGASVDGVGLQREHCIVVERNDDVRGRCVPSWLRAQSALLVSVPYASVSAEDRPVGMTEDERLGFWWNHDRAVTVMIGADPGR